MNKKRQQKGDTYFDHALDCTYANREKPCNKSLEEDGIPSDITEDPMDMCALGRRLWRAFEVLGGKS